jgi:hypothetical protein
MSTLGFLSEFTPDLLLLYAWSLQLGSKEALADWCYRIFQTGSPINVPAGHSVNLDHVTAHYARQFQAEEEKKAKAAAERSREGN